MPLLKRVVSTRNYMHNIILSCTGKTSYYTRIYQQHVAAVTKIKLVLTVYMKAVGGLNAVRLRVFNEGQTLILATMITD